MAICGVAYHIITGWNLDESFRQSDLGETGRESPDISVFDYCQVFHDSMLITFQFSSGIFSLGKSPLRSIQLVKTANGPFFISQYQYTSIFVLSQGWKRPLNGL